MIVYSQRCARSLLRACRSSSAASRRALRRIAHFDYWSEKVRRSILLDSRADLLAVRQRRARASSRSRTGSPGAKPSTTITRPAWHGLHVADHWPRRLERARLAPTSMRPGPVDRRIPDPYAMDPATSAAGEGRRSGRARSDERAGPDNLVSIRTTRGAQASPPASGTASLSGCPRSRQVRRGSGRSTHTPPACLHLESNPGNARAAWCSRTGTGTCGSIHRRSRSPRGRLDRDLRAALHSGCRTRRYGDAKIPAYEMIRFSVAITARLFRRLHLLLHHRARGAHHPEPQRGIDPAARSKRIRDVTCRDSPGVISDLGGPTANMYRLACKSARHRGRLPQALPASTRRSATTSTPNHRPLMRALPQGTLARRASRRCSIGLRRALRPRDASHPSTSSELVAAPRRRLPQDRAGARRGRARCRR